MWREALVVWIPWWEDKLRPTQKDMDRWRYILDAEEKYDEVKRLAEDKWRRKMTHQPSDTEDGILTA